MEPTSVPEESSCDSISPDGAVARVLAACAPPVGGAGARRLIVLCLLVGCELPSMLTSSSAGSGRPYRTYGYGWYMSLGGIAPLSSTSLPISIADVRIVGRVVSI